MKTETGVSNAYSSNDGIEGERDRSRKVVWKPQPKFSHLKPLPSPSGMSTADHSPHWNEFGPGGSVGRVVSVTCPSVSEESPSSVSCDDVRFGFAAPDDRIVSLNVPASTYDGQRHPFWTFDIEFDSDHPDHIGICLFEADADNFIRTVQRSIPFPARLLAELLSRRKATAQEAASWHAATDD
jgi:hypothetical protein